MYLLFICIFYNHLKTHCSWLEIKVHNKKINNFVFILFDFSPSIFGYTTVFRDLFSTSDLAGAEFLN